MPLSRPASTTTPVETRAPAERVSGQTGPSGTGEGDDGSSLSFALVSWWRLELLRRWPAVTRRTSAGLCDFSRDLYSSEAQATLFRGAKSRERWPGCRFGRAGHDGKESLSLREEVVEMELELLSRCENTVVTEVLSRLRPAPNGSGPHCHLDVRRKRIDAGLEGRTGPNTSLQASDGVGRGRWAVTGGRHRVFQGRD